MSPHHSNIKFCLGIDISKKNYHVALLLKEDRRIITQSSYNNNKKGHQALHAWLIKNTTQDLPVHVCLEATGSYGDEVSFFLNSKVARLSVVNPRAIKCFGDSELRRCKSDPADARLIAKYCLEKQPSPWIEPTPHQQKLKALSRRIDCLKKNLIQEQNRLDVTTDKDTQNDLNSHLRYLKNHIAKLNEKLLEVINEDSQEKKNYELLISIIGLGKKSAAYLIAEIPDITIYESSRQLAAYAGVTPRIQESGTSGKIRTPMSKAGSSQIRKSLFFPAMSAMRYNPVCKALAERIKAKGHPPMVALGAVMHKLLHLIYGVLKNQQPFDPNYLNKCQKTT